MIASRLAPVGESKLTMYFFLILKENVEFDKMKLGGGVGVGAVIAGVCSFEYPLTLLERAP